MCKNQNYSIKKHITHKEKRHITHKEARGRGAIFLFTFVLFLLFCFWIRGAHGLMFIQTKKKKRGTCTWSHSVHERREYHIVCIQTSKRRLTQKKHQNGGLLIGNFILVLYFFVSKLVFFMSFSFL